LQPLVLPHGLEQPFRGKIFVAKKIRGTRAGAPARIKIIPCPKHLKLLLLCLCGKVKFCMKKFERCNGFSCLFKEVVTGGPMNCCWPQRGFSG